MSTVAYDSRTVNMARELRRAGWSIPSICTLIEQETGQRPQRSTVYYWLHDDYAERRRKARRQQKNAATAAQSTGSMRSNHGSPEFMLARMRRLREIGLSYMAIAKVMGLDFDVRLTRSEVEGALAADRLPRSMRRAA